MRTLAALRLVCCALRLVAARKHGPRSKPRALKSQYEDATGAGRNIEVGDALIFLRLDRAGNIYAANRCEWQSISVYAASATGVATPARIIAGTNSTDSDVVKLTILPEADSRRCTTSGSRDRIAVLAVISRRPAQRTVPKNIDVCFQAIV